MSEESKSEQPILPLAEQVILREMVREQQKRGLGDEPSMVLGIWSEGPENPPTVLLGREEVTERIDPEELLRGKVSLEGEGYIFRGLANPNTMVVSVDLAPWGIVSEEEIIQRLATILGEEKSPRPRRRKGPLPQPTAKEIRNAGIALADAPYGEHWEEVRGELALVHQIPNDTLATKLTGDVLPWWGLQPQEQELWAVLKEAGIPAVLLHLETIGRIMELPRDRSIVTVDLDELVQAIGLRPRSTAARLEARKKVYKLLLLLENIEVHGVRDGVWKNPRTGEKLDLHSRDPLIRIMGKRMPEQGTLDGSEIPVEVSFAAGVWLEKFRGDRRILTDLGDLRRLTQIPTGKPSGALAQRLGLALNQRWRQEATDGHIGHTGEENRLTFRPPYPYRRKELCEMFRGEPDLKEILDSDKPIRAREYWKEAIGILKAEGVIGYDKELDPMPPTGRGVSGWQTFWYEEQRLDIRPKGETTEAIAEINQTARAARAARSRAKKSREKKSREKSKAEAGKPGGK